MEFVIQLLPLLLFFVIIYFLLIKPQKKQQQAILEMQSNLNKGDKVVTIGGIHGIIDAVNEDDIVLTVIDGSKIRFNKSAIATITTEDAE